MSRSVVPDLGDFVWLDFDPQVGRAQAGRRPALVVTPKAYNRTTGIALVCPVTSQIKGYPFEVPVPHGIKVQGVILADHVKSLDWGARRAVHICKAPSGVTLRVLAVIESLFDEEA